MSGADRAWWRWTLAAAATGVALRLRYLTLPLTPDEGGGLAVARSWAAGRRLYTDVFIDRPQGVVWAYQGWDRFGLGPSSLRVLAIAAGLSAGLAVAVAARELGGSWRAGAAAAWLAAVIGASPAIEGYSANGELLAAAFSAPAMAVVAVALVRGRRLVPAMAAAGALSGLALSMKQSGYDALGAIGLWLAIAAVARWRPRRDLAVAALALVAGAGVVLGAFAAHGATLGWDRYAYALVGFRLHTRSAIAGVQWGRLAITAALGVPLFAGAIAVAWRARGARRTDTGAVAAEPGGRGVARLADLWVAGAVAAFLTGGNHHRHYWMGVVFPLATWLGMRIGPEPEEAAGSAPALEPTRLPATATAALRRRVAVAVALPLVISAVLVAAPGLERDPRLDADVAIARWWHDHGGDQAHPLLPLCASAGFYAAADELPPYPYLWLDHVRFAHGATDQLVALLSGPDAPAFVARYQPLERCDPSGRLAAVVARRYREVVEIEGVPVLSRVPGST